MRSSRGLWTGAVVVVGILLGGRGAVAQMGNTPGSTATSGGQAGSPSTMPMAVQMYGNPMMNPYLNPYAATQLRGTSPDAALYFYSANQMNGGIGTGVISGTRSAPGVAAGSTPSGMTKPPGLSKPTNASNRPMGSRPVVLRPAAEMPMATAVPGASAAKYFGRSNRTGEGAAAYYNRSQSRFQNNGR